MTERFRNTYRVPSARMRTWDYTTHAAYFITICTAKHDSYFGDIARGGGVASVETPCMASLRKESAIIRLSELGEIVQLE